MRPRSLFFAPLFLLLTGPLVGLAQSPVSPLEAPGEIWNRPGTSATIAAVPPEVLEEIRVGRYWHASQLWASLSWRGGEDAPGRLARAQVAAGWRDWPEVSRLLDGSTRDSLDPEMAVEAEFLLGRALEAGEDWSGAAEAYQRWLSLAPAEAPARPAVLARAARVLARDGSGDRAALLARSITDPGGVVGSWSSLEVARILAEEGDTAGVSSVVLSITDPVAADRASLLLAEAVLETGDTARALDLYLRAAEGSDDAARRRTALARVGDLSLARGDTARALEAFAQVLAEGDRGESVVRAAEVTLDLTEPGPDQLLVLGVILARGGETQAAVEAYGRWLSLAEGAPLPPQDALRHGRLLRAVGRTSQAAETFRRLGSTEDPGVAAPALQELARLRRAQDRRGDARSVEDELVRRFPQRPEAVSVVFFRGDDRHDAGDLDGAVASYRETAGMNPAQNEAGLARMRWAQIHIRRGEFGDAAGVYEGYLRDFPDGRRWAEASYWAAWSHFMSGDTASANPHLERIKGQDPLSYYSILGARLVGDTFSVPMADGPQITGEPPLWLQAGLVSVDLLELASLDAARTVAVERLSAQAGEDPVALLFLAEALNERGQTWQGIRLAWKVKGLGFPWDRRLLEAVYPYPDRDAVEREALERGLDPFVVAGLIRQESAFWPEAVSSAGAIGLMQVMPATGAQLARSLGPRSFTRETLFSPEINVHLGSAFLAELIERFGPELPFVFAAYNAGPTRMNRWKAFPEAEDPVRFTERVPFAETRDYLKSVARNAEIYRWLYSEGS